MFGADGLEWYERGDVWHRVITDEHRSALDGSSGQQLNNLAKGIRPLLLFDAEMLMRHGGVLEPITGWATAFRDTGRALHQAVLAGTLDRGLRQVLSYHVLFHWNRLGLSLRGQSALAWAARTAILHDGEI